MVPDHNTEKITAFLRKQNCTQDETVLTKLTSYLALLEKWNRVMNLTGLRTIDAILSDLVLDSFHLATFLSTLPLSDQGSAYDLGAGSGLPGIPLRLLWQQGSYYLVERGAKRATFLRTVVSRLSLPQTFVLEQDVTTLLPEKKGK
ncbi:MAG: class I SAM-dependent methyltransferase, partial [Desulfovibrio sp.]|nr:class I SAM-dependent methyltransferase [Desulfovibrio sp.]